MYVAMMHEAGGAGCCANDEYHDFFLSTVEAMKKVKYPSNAVHSALVFAEKGYSSCAAGKGDTPEQAWEACLQNAMDRWGHPDYTGVQNRFFWFVKKKDGEGGYNAEYDNHALRDLVRSKVDKGEGVWLGEHRNANTGNMVDGYMLTYNLEGYEDDDE